MRFIAVTKCQYVRGERVHKLTNAQRLALCKGEGYSSKINQKPNWDFTLGHWNLTTKYKTVYSLDKLKQKILNFTIYHITWKP